MLLASHISKWKSLKKWRTALGAPCSDEGKNLLCTPDTVVVLTEFLCSQQLRHGWKFNRIFFLAWKYNSIGQSFKDWDSPPLMEDARARLGDMISEARFVVSLGATCSQLLEPEALQQGAPFCWLYQISRPTFWFLCLVWPIQRHHTACQSQYSCCGTVLFPSVPEEGRVAHTSLGGLAGL